jgi:hypothetical protein
VAFQPLLSRADRDAESCSNRIDPFAARATKHNLLSTINTGARNTVAGILMKFARLKILIPVWDAPKGSKHFKSNDQLIGVHS